MTSAEKLLAFCLSGVMVCLLLVGIVSSTVLRHAVQVAPIALVLAAVSQKYPLAPYFAVPVFAIWGSLMMLIWLYLLGIQTFVSGSFSPVEVVLTVFIGGFSVVGIAACLRHSTARMSHRIAAIGLFAIVQVAAMWISFLPAVANR